MLKKSWQNLGLWGVMLLSTSLTLSGCSVSEILEMKAKSGLQVVTNETQPAALFLNGDYLEKTPFINKNIKPGIYKLKIQPSDSDYVPYETQITLNQGTLTVVTWNPGKSPETSGGVIYELFDQETKDNSTATLNFQTIPDSAIITFDNQPQTFSPLNLDSVAPGNHEFEVKLPSYVTQKHTLNAVAGKKLLVTVKLAKQDMSSLIPSLAPTQAAPSLPGKPSLDAIASSSAINAASLSAKMATTPAINSDIASVKAGQKVQIMSTGFTQNNQEVLRVRSQASAFGDPVGYAVVGQVYEVTQPAKEGWVEIKVSPQLTGWANQNYLKPQSP